MSSGVLLRVQDTGAGIAGEHLAHVFERFWQADASMTRSHGGLGLGLAIVRHLVEAHGGAVEAHSEGTGRGSTFTINLPSRDTETVRGETSAASETVGARGTSHPGVPLRYTRVLAVDDDPDSLDLLSAILRDAGARVTAVRSARETLAAQGPFDIVVSDIAMPEMDGYSFMRCLRKGESGAPIPAIALTAYAGEGAVESAKRAGFHQHIAKPVDAKTLVDAVKFWTRLQRDDVEW